VAHRTLRFDTIRSVVTGVGLGLRIDGGLVDLVLSAIRDDNGAGAIHVVDNGDAVDISSPFTVQVTAGTLRWHIGAHFGTAHLRSMIVRPRGTVTTTCDRVVIAAASSAC
jgi:hypothetical protein